MRTRIRLCVFRAAFFSISATRMSKGAVLMIFSRPKPCGACEGSNREEARSPIGEVSKRLKVASRDEMCRREIMATKTMNAQNMTPPDRAMEERRRRVLAGFRSIQVGG